MQDAGRGNSGGSGDRKAIVLEFVAASAILALLVVVLYMVFSYRPV
ncbi:MAG: hypothetical protein IT159_05610 [Bryobacterales bacterium]|nr:hypothetical protein [Bryobacterales bacterium]